MGPFGTWAGAMNMASATATVDVDAAGQVLRCKVTRAANTLVNPCDALPAGKTVVAPTISNGKPVPATVTVITMVSVRPATADAAPTDTRP